MEPNYVIGAVIGGIIMLALPSFLVAMAMRKLGQGDKEDAAKEQRIHESFAAGAAALAEERRKRENLSEEVTKLRVEMAATMRKEDLEGVYTHLEKFEAGVKQDLKDYGITVTQTMQQVITALAGR